MQKLGIMVDLLRLIIIREGFVRTQAYGQRISRTHRREGIHTQLMYRIEKVF